MGLTEKSMLERAEIGEIEARIEKGGITPYKPSDFCCGPVSGTPLLYDASEFYKLKFMLEEAGIPFENTSTINSPGYRDGTVRLQLCYPSKAEKVSDVMFHEHSYGFDEGLLEMYGLVDEEKVGDTVQGYMTAKEVFDVWSNHYLEELYRLKKTAENHKEEENKDD